MDDKRNGERYVTYKWLIGTTLTAMGIALAISSAITGFVYGIVDQRLNQRVPRSAYEVKMDSVEKKLNRIEQITCDYDGRLDRIENTLTEVKTILTVHDKKPGK